MSWAVPVYLPRQPLTPVRPVERGTHTHDHLMPEEPDEPPEEGPSEPKKHELPVRQEEPTSLPEPDNQRSSLTPEGLPALQAQSPVQALAALPN